MEVGPHIFLLSPARLDGARGKLLFRDTAAFPLAKKIRTREGCAIGEVFAFVSGLYFRGKLAYANAFARAPTSSEWMRTLVITQNRGLVSADTRVTVEHLEAFSSTAIHADEPTFRKPLVRDAKMIADATTQHGGDVILLGSIASAKYVEPLLEVFGERLLFPKDFVGRGDMSRGGLLLRAVDAKKELEYASVQGANRKGTRPPKLEPRRKSRDA